MNSSYSDNSLFSELRFVLVESSHPGNVGMVARAMKTMGFSRLILVKPRISNVLKQEAAIKFASNALDILENTQIVDSIEEAIKDCNFTGALTSRSRELAPPIMNAREVATHIALNPQLKPALIFGSEKYGLPNEVVEKCHALINISANPDYASLNLAQAVQILAYECRMSLLNPKTNVPSATKGASIEQIDGMISHLEEALVAIDFLDEENPRKLMPRLRRLFARGQIEVDEVNILRGIAKQILYKTKS